MRLTHLRLFRVAFICFGLFAVAARPAAAQVGASPSHLQLAEKLVANISPQDTSYNHGHGSVQLSGYDGATKYECHTDCSGLLNHLLHFAYRVNESDLRSW